MRFIQADDDDGACAWAAQPIVGVAQA